MKLIAGVDPGTTVGWAVLNLQGGLVDIGSRKEFDLDSLVAHFVKLGRVIIIGSDKAKVPFFVQDAGVKLGAKVVYPSEDVRVDEKRALASDFSFGNSHEMDALASAFIAFKKIKPLLNKIRSFLDKERKLGFFEDVVEIVLKEGVSIRAALVLLTPKEEEKVEEFVEEKRDEDIVHLYSALSRVRKDNVVLLEKNKALQKRVFSLEQELASLKQRVSTLVRPKTHAEIARLKEFQVKSLSNRLSGAVKLQDKLKSQIAVLEKVLFSKDIVPVLHLSKLGWEEVLRFKDFLGSVVFVDDCNQMSEKAVEFLHKQGIQVLVCRKMPSRAAKANLPFACVPAPACRIVDHVALVDKLWLVKVCSERVVLAELVDEYKKERAIWRS